MTWLFFCLKKIGILALSHQTCSWKQVWFLAYYFGQLFFTLKMRIMFQDILNCLLSLVIVLVFKTGCLFLLFLLFSHEMFISLKSIPIFWRASAVRFIFHWCNLKGPRAGSSLANHTFKELKASTFVKKL